MLRLEAERRTNGEREVGLRSGSEEAECDVSVGQKARAASAAGEGSPRGPGVLARGAFLRERSSARSCGINPCRSGKEMKGQHVARARPRRRCQKSSGRAAILGRCVQTGTFALTELVKSSRPHKPIPRGAHPSSLLTRTDTPPTTWASPARAQRGSGASPCWEVAKASVDVREQRERTAP
jgi:hypothetical protein